ncbi:hypothetical protein Tco_0755745 [Tanacetum coccineum]
MIVGIEDSHHGPNDAMHNPPWPLKSPTHYPHDLARTFRLVLFSISQCRMEILPVSTSNSTAVVKDYQGRLLDNFQGDIKYEHVGPKTQDRKKAKYYKGDQVMRNHLKSKVKTQRQRKDQDQDHKSMIGTKGASTINTWTRLKIKTRSIKDQRSMP